jgi:hypothetical protein
MALSSGRGSFVMGELALGQFFGFFGSLRYAINLFTDILHRKVCDYISDQRVSWVQSKEFMLSTTCR